MREEVSQAAAGEGPSKEQRGASQAGRESGLGGGAVRWTEWVSLCRGSVDLLAVVAAV